MMKIDAMIKIDPMVKPVIHILFSTYTIMLFTRIALSFFPSLYRYRFAHFLIFITEPYLKLFRKFIPPIGGTIDVSPTLALIALQFLESFLMKVL